MLDLTKQERLVLIFIGLSALVGAGINFYQKTSAPSLNIPKILDGQKLSSPLNINNASLDDLSRISAIGPALAEAIIDFRRQRGAFKSLEELKLIKGISQSKFNQIKAFLTLG